MIDTGKNTMTGGRLKRVGKLFKDDTFFMTYGDGLSDVNLNKLLKFHLKKKACKFNSCKTSSSIWRIEN